MVEHSLSKSSQARTSSQSMARETRQVMFQTTWTPLNLDPVAATTQMSNCIKLPSRCDATPPPIPVSLHHATQQRNQGQTAVETSNTLPENLTSRRRLAFFNHGISQTVKTSTANKCACIRASAVQSTSERETENHHE